MYRYQQHTHMCVYLLSARSLSSSVHVFTDSLCESRSGPVMLQTPWQDSLHSLIHSPIHYHHTRTHTGSQWEREGHQVRGHPVSSITTETRWHNSKLYMTTGHKGGETEKCVRSTNLKFPGRFPDSTLVHQSVSFVKLHSVSIWCTRHSSWRTD